jgi:hypothetical protein
MATRTAETLDCDYDELRDLFARVAAARAEGQVELAAEICRELLESAAVEEEILYSATPEYIDDARETSL